MVKHRPTMRKTQVRSLGRADPLEKKWQPTPVFLPGKFHGLRILVGYSQWGFKESETTEKLHFKECLTMLVVDWKHHICVWAF